jgi:hypothetical protein
MTTHPKGCHVLMAMKCTAAMAAVLGFAVLAAGCGGSNGSGSARSASTKAQFLAYSRCMRSHGVSDFPDPTTPAGGGVAFSINGGPGSDLNSNNPTYKSANQTCRALLPAGVQSATGRSPKIAAEVRWARCMRSHGVPSFPDPNNQGAFDSAKFNDTTPAFHTASKACTPLQPTGAVTAVAGQP